MEKTMYVAPWMARRARVGLRDGLGEGPQVRDAALDHPVDGLDRLLAGDLARGVTPHTVGDDVEADLVVEEIGVLVRRSLSPEVSEADGLHGEGGFRHMPERVTGQGAGVSGV